MTKREAAIVSAYTGFLVGEFSEMQAYAEERLGRSIWTHEFASGSPVPKQLREAAKDDFVDLSRRLTP